MDSIKVLGQVNPNITSPTVLYTVPSVTQTTTSSLVICNLTGTGTTFRVAIRAGGEATAAKHFIYYDTAISGNESVAKVLGMTLSEGDIVEVYASSASLSFNLFGVETT